MVRFKRIRVKKHIRRAKPLKGMDRTHAPVKSHFRRIKIKTN